MIDFTDFDKILNEIKFHILIDFNNDDDLELINDIIKQIDKNI